MINLTDIKNSTDPNVKFDNRYRLIEKIGGGGFSEVWLAFDSDAGIEVALKIYVPNGDLDEEGKEDFKREFARLCGLNHSNIIHAIGFGIHEEELPYLVMNICKNGSAKKLIGNYEEEQLWDFIEQVALGLQYLHSHDITHQDIKPDNILINSDGQYLIIDFGISTRTRNTLRKTDKESIGGGTPWYMSNESYVPESSDIHARDIWAFGATLYEIITGDVPFGQYGGLTQQAQKGKIPTIKANVSSQVKELVYDCLALNSWDRPSADSILARVKAHRSGKKTIKVRKQWTMMAASLLLGICCIIWYFTSPSPKPVEVGEEIVMSNKNDSIFLEKINRAVTLAEPELAKNDLSAVDETVLCSAAAIYAEAIQLEVSESLKEEGDRIWSASQEMIDNTYEFLYNKGLYYQTIMAESASQKFKKRSSALSDFVTSSKIQKEN